MFLIEVKNRAKAVKNLNQPPKFLPVLGMEGIHRWGRASPSLVGASFFGDDADIMGLKLADVQHWYAGPFDENTVSEISGHLAKIEAHIAGQKDFCARLQADLQPDIQNIASTIDRYRQISPTSGYLEHLAKIDRLAVNIGKRPSISSDSVIRSMAAHVAGMIVGKIVRP